MPRLLDLSGQRFGRVTVIQRSHGKGHSIYWRCLCDCGNSTALLGSGLRDGKTISCGCARRSDPDSGMNPKDYAILAKCWRELIRRCTSSHDAHFPNYGGRGIGVCERWSSPDGLEFFIRDMGVRPSAHHSIDRKNNMADYSPDNCRWATLTEQNRNRRSNRYFEWDGETLLLADWSRKLGIHSSTIKRSLSRGKTIGDLIKQGPSMSRIK